MTTTTTDQHWTTETYRLLDAGDPRAWQNFAPDIRVRLGNNPVADGIEAAGRAFQPLSEAAPTMSHNILAVHDLAPHRAAVEAEVTYNRRDGRSVTVPVLTIVERDGAGRFKDLQLFFDPSPVFQGQEAHISIEGTVPATTDAQQTEFARDAIWEALVDKAHNATKYVPNITECTVVDSGPGWILRDVILDGYHTQERVTFEPQSRILFTRTRSNMMGTVENFLDEADDGSLTLRFRFDLVCSAIADGTALADEIRNGMRAGYLHTFTEVAGNILRRANSAHS